MSFSFHPVTEDRWKDFEELFESRGSPHYCWCTAWRKVEKAGKKTQIHEKKNMMKDRAEKGIPIGILAYENNEPVAWCSIAPRVTYGSLGGDETIDEVWSLVCFFIQRPHRGRHLSYLLLAEAVQYARSNGAKFVEAYPVDPDSPSYRFMGFKGMFERAGFKFVKMAGKRRNVMVLELK